MEHCLTGRIYKTNFIWEQNRFHNKHKTIHILFKKGQVKANHKPV